MLLCGMPCENRIAAAGAANGRSASGRWMAELAEALTEPGVLQTRGTRGMTDVGGRRRFGLGLMMEHVMANLPFKWV